MYRLFTLAILLSSVSYAQVNVSPHSRMMFQKSAFGFVSELPPAPPKTIGSTYYEEDWLLADLFLKGETKLEGVRVKLDLSSQSFEILHDGAIKVLPGDQVLSFQWRNTNGEQEAFVRGNYVTAEGLPINGFFKLVSDSEPYKLLELYTTEKLSSNYNQQLDVGRKDHQIVKKVRTFIAREKLLLEVKGGKKKLISEFKETFQTDVTAIIKEFDIDTHDEQELLVLIKQLNYSNPG